MRKRRKSTQFEFSLGPEPFRLVGETLSIQVPRPAAAIDGAILPPPAYEEMDCLLPSDPQPGVVYHLPGWVQHGIGKRR